LWGNTYVYVSESVSRTSCSSGTFAAIFVQGYFYNGKYVNGNADATDYTCDGKYVVKNNVKIDEGGSKLLKYRAIVVAGGSTYTGNWVDNPYT
jgi:lipopolysaccharide export system protein LptA